MSNDFFGEFGGYGNLRSGQFSQELTGQLSGRGEGTVEVGKSKNVNVIEQAQQRAIQQVDVLASAARQDTQVSGGASAAPRTPSSSPTSFQNAATSSGNDERQSGPAATQMRRVDTAGPVTVQTVVTTTTTNSGNVSTAASGNTSEVRPSTAFRQQQAEAEEDANDFSSYSPPGQDDPAEIARLLAEEAKALEDE